MEVDRAAGGLMDRYQRRVEITDLSSDLCEHGQIIFLLATRASEPHFYGPELDRGRAANPNHPALFS